MTDKENFYKVKHVVSRKLKEEPRFICQVCNYQWSPSEYHTVREYNEGETCPNCKSKDISNY